MKQNIDNTRINDIDGLKFDVNYMTFVSRSRSSSEKRTSPTSLLLTGATMPRKCCIPGCKSNYFYRKIWKKPPEKAPVYRFPRDREELERWKKALLFSDIQMSADTVICELHWPDDVTKVPARGKPRPKRPPTVEPGVLSSRIPRPMPPPRTTSKAF